MGRYLIVEIGYNGAAGAGGDVVTEFKIAHDQALWFTRTFFQGLRVLKSHSGFVRLRGRKASLVLSCVNYTEPDYENIALPEPFRQN